MEGPPEVMAAQKNITNYKIFTRIDFLELIMSRSSSRAFTFSGCIILQGTLRPLNSPWHVSFRCFLAHFIPFYNGWPLKNVARWESLHMNRALISAATGVRITPLRFCFDLKQYACDNHITRWSYGYAFPSWAPFFYHRFSPRELWRKLMRSSHWSSCCSACYNLSAPQGAPLSPRNILKKMLFAPYSTLGGKGGDIRTGGRS